MQVELSADSPDLRFSFGMYASQGERAAMEDRVVAEVSTLGILKKSPSGVRVPQLQSHSLPLDEPLKEELHPMFLIHY